MNVAYRGLRPQISLRGALLLGAAVLMIIVGLLGMHTFSADAAGHRTAIASNTVLTNDHAAAQSSHGGSAEGAVVSGGLTTCDDACLSSSAGGHSNMLGACVLALLAGLLLLLRPVLSHRLEPPLLSILPSLQPDIDRRLSRAPSLTFLSISRT